MKTIVRCLAMGAWLALAAAPAVALAADAKPFSLKIAYADTAPPGDLRTRNVQWMLDEITKRTNGAITFSPYWSGSLVTGNAMAVGVTNGYPQMASWLYLGDTSYVRAVEILSLLSRGDSDEAVIRASYDAVMNDPNIRKALSAKKLVPIGVFGHLGDMVVLSNQDVQKMSDAKGLKLRVTGGVNAAIIAKIGAEPITLPASETYEAMQRRTVAGVVSSTKDMDTFKWTELGKYLWPTGVTLGVPMIYVMNEDVWKSIPPDMQAIIVQVGKEQLAKQIDDYRNDLGQIVQKMKTNGIVFRDQNPEIVAAANAVKKEAVAKWLGQMNAAGQPGEAVLKGYSDALDRAKK